MIYGFYFGKTFSHEKWCLCLFYPIELNIFLDLYIKRKITFTDTVGEFGLVWFSFFVKWHINLRALVNVPTILVEDAQ